MTDVFKDQEWFMKTCDQSVGVHNQNQFDMYVKLIDEETNELADAIFEQDSVETLDALIDILVVTIGAIHSMGADAEGAWEEVMKTNAAKIDLDTGKVRKREDGKVLKPVGWVAPNLESFIKKESKMTESYTGEEIYKMFNDSNLKQEFKNVINQRYMALEQAMYNAVHKPEVMTMAEPHGDVWIEEHNRVATEYQRHHDPVSVGS